MGLHSEVVLMEVMNLIDPMDVDADTLDDEGRDEGVWVSPEPLHGL